MPCDTKGTELHKLTDEQIEILEFRFGFSLKLLCRHHYYDQFSRYKGWHKKCSDPMSTHAKNVRAGLREIQLDFAKKVKMYTESKIVPGQKICRNCALKLGEQVCEGEGRGGEEQGGARGLKVEAGYPFYADYPGMEVDSQR